MPKQSKFEEALTDIFPAETVAYIRRLFAYALFECALSTKNTQGKGVDHERNRY